MKRIVVCVAAALQLFAMAAFAETTGDAEMDSQVASINEAAATDLSGTISAVSQELGVSEQTVTDLTQQGMTVGDVAVAVTVAEVTNTPVTEVVKAYMTNPGKGWGVVAKRLGIAPGSPEFHAMKKEMREAAQAEKAARDAAKAAREAAAKATREAKTEKSRGGDDSGNDNGGNGGNGGGRGGSGGGKGGGKGK